MFIKNVPKPWSFTDCFSFIVMRGMRMAEALSKDKHFKAAGFSPLLA
jgi:predicted nucleic acid-binding protein